MSKSALKASESEVNMYLYVSDRHFHTEFGR